MDSGPEKRPPPQPATAAVNSILWDVEEGALCECSLIFRALTDEKLMARIPHSRVQTNSSLSFICVPSQTISSPTSSGPMTAQTTTAIPDPTHLPSIKLLLDSRLSRVEMPVTPESPPWIRCWKISSAPARRRVLTASQAPPRRLRLLRLWERSRPRVRCILMTGIIVHHWRISMCINGSRPTHYKIGLVP